MTIKLYSPLTGDFYENEIDGDGWINTAQEPFLLSGADLAQYKDSIDSLLNRYLDGDKNLMDYFDEERNSSLKEKVTSAVPSVEIRERDLWGCTTVKLTSPLTDTEQKDLQDYLIGQFADGWGEGFEQREIEVDGGTLYVHFWNPDNFTFELGPIEPQEKEPEIIKQVQRPKMRLYGQDGNIFNLVGIAERTLREHGLTDQAKEMKDRVFASGSYGEALCIIGEYVNITDTEPEQRPSLRQQLKETKTAEPSARLKPEKQQER